MKYKYISFALTLLTHAGIGMQYAEAQYTKIPDTSFQKHFLIPEKRVSLKSFITPVSIFGYGVCVNKESLFISDAEIKEERDEQFRNFHTTIDDYLQFAPIAAGYVMMIDHPEHDFWLFTKRVALNELIISLAVPKIKHLSKVPKPNSTAYNAFPSGHTAQAFSGATLFVDEFASGKPWMYISAYGSAASVGVLRVLNNKHWASDVIAGAGFGILSAKLSELIVQHTEKRKSNKTIHY
jgi:hypothetical protein